MTASGYSANALGGVVQCSSAPGQPTIAVQGNAVPVSCTNPLNALKSTDASGGFSGPFTVHTGAPGPPAQGTDSAGNPASADAAKYPCPPTPAQQAAGITCVIGYGDTSGEQASAPISFAAGATSSSSASSGTTTQSGSTAGASGTSGTSPSSAAGGGTSGGLAFTGSGSGLWRMAWSGVLLTLIGLTLIGASGLSMLRRRRLVAPVD